MKISNQPESTYISVLLDLLKEIPVIDDVNVVNHGHSNDAGIDYLVQIKSPLGLHILACETKMDGQPRFVRSAIRNLHAYMYGRKDIMTPLVIAPYLSPTSRELCHKNDIAYLDLEGNARIQFGGIYINHQVPGKPASEKRELQSIFSPKSAQVLKLMLNDRHRAWRVAELAAEGHVSLGHVSNVRQKLLAREWAVIDDEGLILSRPESLLDEWKASYKPPPGKILEFYTPLHGNMLETRLKMLLGHDEKSGYAVLASFSAAQWLAPYGRTGVHYFYADKKGIQKLKEDLNLSAVTKGANVQITIPDHPGVFLDSIEPASGICTTGIVQTYLDLFSQGERGQESAEHLRKMRMDW